MNPLPRRALLGARLPRGQRGVRRRRRRDRRRDRARHGRARRTRGRRPSGLARRVSPCATRASSPRRCARRRRSHGGARLRPRAASDSCGTVDGDRDAVAGVRSCGVTASASRGAGARLRTIACAPRLRAACARARMPGHRVRVGRSRAARGAPRRPRRWLGTRRLRLAALRQARRRRQRGRALPRRSIFGPSSPTRARCSPPPSRSGEARGIPVVVFGHRWVESSRRTSRCSPRAGIVVYGAPVMSLAGVPGRQHAAAARASRRAARRILESPALEARAPSRQSQRPLRRIPRQLARSMIAAAWRGVEVPCSSCAASRIGSCAPMTRRGSRAGARPHDGDGLARPRSPGRLAPRPRSEPARLRRGPLRRRAAGRHDPLDPSSGRARSRA